MRINQCKMKMYVKVSLPSHKDAMVVEGMVVELNARR